MKKIMPLLSIAIPSRNEPYLKKTILGVLENSRGDIEIYPVLDGYEPPADELVDDPRVHYLRLPLGDGACHKRQGVNKMVEVCNGDFVMWLDAHCIVGPGFDLTLINDHQQNMVQVLQRRRLDAVNWCEQIQQDGRPTIDYEYIQYPPKFNETGFHGFRWDARTLERKDILIDEIITCQGSMFFMAKEWFLKNNFMDIKYQGWGQEAEEICFTTWLNGGKVCVNKKNYYMHWHKGKAGRQYHLSRELNRKSYEYCFDFWMNNRLESRVQDFDWLIEKFMPMPGWKSNWKEEMGYKK